MEKCQRAVAWFWFGKPPRSSDVYLMWIQIIWTSWANFIPGIAPLKLMDLILLWFAPLEDRSKSIADREIRLMREQHQAQWSYPRLILTSESTALNSLYVRFLAHPFCSYHKYHKNRHFHASPTLPVLVLNRKKEIKNQTFQNSSKRVFVLILIKKALYGWSMWGSWQYSYLFPNLSSHLYWMDIIMETYDQILISAPPVLIRMEYSWLPTA